MDVLIRWGQTVKEQKVPFSFSISLYRISADGMVEIKGVCLSNSKIQIWCASLFLKLSKKSFIEVIPPFWVLVPDLVKLKAKSIHNNITTQDLSIVCV